jgi:replicative DNA helicase
MAQSLGLNLLAKVLTDGRLSDFHALNPDYFHGDNEREVYDWINQHVDRYGVLPSMPLARRKTKRKIAEVDSDDPYGVWFDEYINRAIFSQFNTLMPALNRMLSARQSQEALDAVMEFVDNAHSIRTSGAQDLVTATQVGGEMLDHLRELRRTHGLSGITSGWRYLDEMTHGFQGGDLIIFAARPGIGKSTAMIEMARHAHSARHVPLFVSMEMKRVQIGARLFASAAGSNMPMLKRGEMTTHLERRLIEVVDDFEAQTQFYFIEGAFRKSIGEIASLVLSLRPDILFIDGAYLLQIPHTHRMAKWEIVAEIAQALKNIAMVANIPVITSFQITREGGKRKKESDVGSEHLQLSDALGQLASLIVGIFEIRSDATDGGDDEREPYRRFRVLKGREGERGKWEINWDFDCMNFEQTQIAGTGDVGVEPMTDSVVEED